MSGELSSLIIDTSPIPGTYALVDSGEGVRVEQWGEYLLERPSSLACWQRRGVADYVPDGVYLPASGWRTSRKLPAQWPVIIDGVTMFARCQSNGQVGVFPEHATYLPEIRAVASRPGARILNLFAYTGLASIAAAAAGAEVTHVDLSKSAIGWARENAGENNISSIRFITEDALSFLNREIKRGSRYDLIIADPPSFSRPTPKSRWELGEIIVPLLEAMICLLRWTGDRSERGQEGRGELIVTTHSYEVGNLVIENLIRDCVSAEGGAMGVRFRESRQLVIRENAGRGLAAGFLVWGEVTRA